MDIRFSYFFFFFFFLAANAIMLATNAALCCRHSSLPDIIVVCCRHHLIRQCVPFLGGFLEDAHNLSIYCYCYVFDRSTVYVCGCVVRALWLRIDNWFVADWDLYLCTIVVGRPPYLFCYFSFFFLDKLELQSWRFLSVLQFSLKFYIVSECLTGSGRLFHCLNVDDKKE